jgi:hypothetical protein
VLHKNSNIPPLSPPGPKLMHGSELRRRMRQSCAFADLLTQKRSLLCRKMRRSSTMLPERAILSMNYGPATDSRPTWMQWFMGQSPEGPPKMPPLFKAAKATKRWKEVAGQEDASSCKTSCPRTASPQQR